MNTLEEIGIYVPELARAGRSLTYFSMILLCFRFRYCVKALITCMRRRCWNARMLWGTWLCTVSALLWVLSSSSSCSSWSRCSRQRTLAQRYKMGRQLGTTYTYLVFNESSLDTKGLCDVSWLDHHSLHQWSDWFIRTTQLFWEWWYCNNYPTFAFHSRTSLATMLVKPFSVDLLVHVVIVSVCWWLQHQNLKM